MKWRINHALLLCSIQLNSITYDLNIFVSSLYQIVCVFSSVVVTTKKKTQSFNVFSSPSCFYFLVVLNCIFIAWIDCLEYIQFNLTSSLSAIFSLTDTKYKQKWYSILLLLSLFEFRIHKKKIMSNNGHEPPGNFIFSSRLLSFAWVDFHFSVAIWINTKRNEHRK